MDSHLQYIMDQAKAVLAIDSPSGYTEEVTEYLLQEAARLGVPAQKTIKGGVLMDFGGQDAQDAVLLEAHVDTLGAMVAELKADDRMRLTHIGGLNANNAEAENCRIRTRFSGVYEGTFQLCDASVHVNGKYSETARTFDTCELVLDTDAHSASDVRALGIDVGDPVCFDPRPILTSGG